MLKEGWFEIKNENFYRRTWISDIEPKIASVILIHGYGEHCSRYDYLAGQMNKQGINVFSFDQRGFGYSPGKRAWINCFEDLLSDLDVFLQTISKEIEGLPVFFMGHSMGGMVLARYMQTRRDILVDGLIFSSPFLAINEDVPEILLKLSGVLAKIFPWLPVSKVDNSGLAKDIEVVKKADEDPLGYHGSVKAHTGYVFYQVIKEIHNNFQLIHQPVIVIHGKKDKIVPYSGSVALYERIASKDKEIHLFEDGYHEIWNDFEKDEMIEKVYTWIKERAKKRTT